MQNGDKIINDPIIRNNLIKIARLRGWLENLQFGRIVHKQNSTQLRIIFGCNRGISCWYSPDRIALFLDDTKYKYIA